MKIKCISTEGDTFSQKRISEGATNKTDYSGLELQTSYDVFGIVLFEDSLKYLIFDEYCMPNWYPAEIFRIEDNQLPSNWFHQFYGYQEYGVTAIWGYKELVLSEKHYNGLIEQDENEVEVFKKKN